MFLNKTLRLVAAFGFSLGGVSFAFAAVPPVVAPNVKIHKHPHIHHAIYELKEAQAELAAAKHDFGGHKEKAMAAIDAAVATLESALAKVGDNYQGGNANKAAYKSYKHHHHMHHALHELRKVHVQLTESSSKWGGVRDQAIADVKAAITELHAALRTVSDNTNNKSTANKTAQYKPLSTKTLQALYSTRPRTR